MTPFINRFLQARQVVEEVRPLMDMLRKSVHKISYLEESTMAVTTLIHITAGGATADIVIQDQLGNNLPTSQTAWIVQPAASSGVTITAQPDGFTWRFQASASAVANTVQAQAAYTPTSVGGPVMIVVVAAAPVVVTGIQYNETAGT